MGNILLISGTTSFTIIFTAILSPIFLGEKFRWKIDGVTIMMLAIGSSIAVAQQPSERLEMTSSNTWDFVTAHLFQRSTLFLAAIMTSLVLLKFHLKTKIQADLAAFYENTMMTYNHIQDHRQVEIDSEGSSRKSLRTPIKVEEDTPSDGHDLFVNRADVPEMAKPSDRILIKTVLKHDKHAIQMIQGTSRSEIFNLNFCLRFYLILVNVLSGCFSGMTVVNAKMFLEITGKKDPQEFLSDSMWYLTLVLMVSMVLCNLRNLNQTISLYSQLLVMPTYECCIICGTLLAGGIVMNEFSYYTT